MSDLILLQGLLTAGEALAVSTLVPLAAELFTHTHPRSAAARRLIWLGALGVLLVLPPLAMIAPSLIVLTMPAAPQQAPAPLSVETLGSSSLIMPGLVGLALIAWFVGVAALGLRQLAGLFDRERLTRTAAPWPDPLPLPVRGCTVLLSDRGLGPMTWGVFRPVILLPVEALDWSPERLEAVLRHELAHVRRRDCLAQTLAMLACALYWPNPLVWRAAKALRHEAELAADDAVISAGMRPSDYAGHLLELAKDWQELRLPAPSLAMAAPPALSRRVQSVLSTEAIRTGATAMDAFKLALLGGAATAALVLARPSIAEVAAVRTAEPARVAEAIEVRPLAAAAPAADPRPVASLQPSVRSAVNSAVRIAVRTATAAEPPHANPAENWPLTAEQEAELDRQLDMELELQLKDLGPTIEKAIADAHIEEQVAKALAGVQPKIDAAVARAQAQAEKAARRARERRQAQEL